MSFGVSRRIPETNRGPLFGWRRTVAVFLCILPSLSSTPSSLPDSVLACVPCHNRGDSDQVAEWLASPYRETQGGRGCADCHGPLCSGNGHARTLAGDLSAGEPRAPIEAARLTVSAIFSGDAVKAEVAVSNVGVGHLLPTGSRERTLVLEVAAHDQNGSPLPLWDGSRHPGVRQATARVSERGPTRGTSSENPVTIRPRLRPFATDVRRYRFVAPESGPAHVSARLLLEPASGPPFEMASTSTVCRPPGETP